MKQMSIDDLCDCFRLDPGTGKLYWRVALGTVGKGREAGSLDANGYVRIKIHGKEYKAHRIIFAMTRGRWPTEQVDHINGTKDDNRPDNLREATNTQNAQNAGMYSNNTSGVKGVCWNKRQGKWTARIKLQKRPIYLGVYDDIELAELVVSEARRKYHGEFARRVWP